MKAFFASQKDGFNAHDVGEASLEKSSACTDATATRDFLGSNATGAISESWPDLARTSSSAKQDLNSFGEKTAVQDIFSAEGEASTAWPNMATEKPSVFGEDTALKNSHSEASAAWPSISETVFGENTESKNSPSEAPVAWPGMSSRSPLANEKFGDAWPEMSTNSFLAAEQTDQRKPVEMSTESKDPFSAEGEASAAWPAMSSDSFFISEKGGWRQPVEKGGWRQPIEKSTEAKDPFSVVQAKGEASAAWPEMSSNSSFATDKTGCAGATDPFNGVKVAEGEASAAWPEISSNSFFATQKAGWKQPVGKGTEAKDRFSDAPSEGALSGAWPNMTNTYPPEESTNPFSARNAGTASSNPFSPAPNTEATLAWPSSDPNVMDEGKHGSGMSFANEAVSAWPSSDPEVVDEGKDFSSSNPFDGLRDVRSAEFSSCESGNRFPTKSSEESSVQGPLREDEVLATAPLLEEEVVGKDVGQEEDDKSSGCECNALIEGSELDTVSRRLLEAKRKIETVEHDFERLLKELATQDELNMADDAGDPAPTHFFIGSSPSSCSVGQSSRGCSWSPAPKKKTSD